MATDNSIKDDSKILVRKGRIDSVDIYEIKDSELDALESGDTGDLQLNFAIFLFSVALTAGASLVTSKFKSATAENVFILLFIVGVILGFYFTVSWYRARKTVAKICAKIRARIKEVAPGEAADLVCDDVIEG